MDHEPGVAGGRFWRPFVEALVAPGFENAVVLEIANAAHEALPVPAVQDVVLDFLKGADVRGRRLAAAEPEFATVEEALQAAPRRGR